MSQTYPYSDANMTYSTTDHRYTLTQACVMTELGINMQIFFDTTGDANPSTMPDRILKQISRHLYHWIYAQNPRAKMWTEYLLAKYEPCRDLIKECLLNEVYYNSKNGDFYNFADNEIPFDKEVSPDTKMLLGEALPNGVKLTYRGNIQFFPREWRTDY